MKASATIRNGYLDIPALIEHPRPRRQIPRWERWFAIIGMFCCLDAGIRTLRLLTGTLGPIQNTRGAADFADGSALTQLVLFSVYLASAMLILLHAPQCVPAVFRSNLLWILPALALLSVSWSEAPAISFRRAVALVGTFVFGVYLGTRYSPAALLRLFLTISVIAMALSLVAGIALPAYAIDPSGAWQGVFGHKNQLGQFMALSAALWILYGMATRRRLPAVIGSVSAAGLVLLSRSATAVVLLALLLCVLVIVASWRLLRRIALSALVVLGVFVVAFVARIGTDPEGVLNLLGRDTTLTGRTQLWDAVWQMIRERPWFGYGYGGFWIGFDGPSARVWFATGWNPPNAHNGYFDLLLDLGLAGIIILAPAFLRAIVRASKLAARAPSLDLAFPLVILAFTMISNLTESYLVAYNALSWALFVAVNLQVSTLLRAYRRCRSERIIMRQAVPVGDWKAVSGLARE